jgi:hypothetical protein
MKLTPESTITVICKCAECKGVGVIPNPIWVQFIHSVISTCACAQSEVVL